MKKLLACLLVLMLTFCCALAEETADEVIVEDVIVEDVPAEEAAPAVALDPLPIDFTPGHEPDPARFTANDYEDESITVHMEQVNVGGAMFNVARVKIVDPSQLRTTLSSQLGKKVRTKRIGAMADESNAVVAIGGDYYGDSSRKSGYVVRMGNVIRASFKSYQRDILIVDQNGDFHILPNTWDSKKKTYDDAPLRALLDGGVTPVNSFDFGPALVIDGNVQAISKDYKFNPTGKEPRCAIGQTGPLEYMLVMVSGRGDSNSDGCTLAALANFMQEQGCKQAYNLDGGNSAMIVFNSAESVRVNKSYNGRSISAGRDVSDIIYFATLVNYGLD